MRKFCLVGVGFLSTMGGVYVRGFLYAGFLSWTLYYRIMKGIFLYIHTYIYIYISNKYVT